MDIHYHQIEYGKIAFAWSHAPCQQPLIVLHGLGDSAIHTYAPRFASTVLRDTPALFIDFPGFGESEVEITYSATLETMAAHVVDLLTQLGVKNAPMFAHSMGANTALILANNHVGLTSRLLLAEPLLQPDQSILAAGIAKMSETAFLARGYSMLVRATSLQAHRGDAAAIAFLPVLAMANPRSLHQAAVSLLQPRSPAFVQMLQQNDQNTVILTGSKANIDRMGLHLAGIRIINVQNAGHFMMAEQSSATAYAILKLVDGMHYGEPGNC